MPQVTELARQGGVGRACAALGVPRSSYYRFRTPKTTNRVSRKRAAAPRALTLEEQEAVRQELGSDRFCQGQLTIDPLRQLGIDPP